MCLGFRCLHCNACCSSRCGSQLTSTKSESINQGNMLHKAEVLNHGQWIIMYIIMQHCIHTLHLWKQVGHVRKISARILQCGISHSPPFSEVPVWSKSMVNAVAKCDPMEGQGPSIREAAHRTLVTVCDKFQLVRCSQSVVSYGWEVCFKMCHKSWITNNALTQNFVSNCKKVPKKHTKC